MMKKVSKMMAIALGVICSLGILAVPTVSNAAEIQRPTATGVRFDANGDGRVSVLDLIRAWKEYSYTRAENPEQAPSGFVYCTTDMLTSGKDTVQLSDIKNLRSKFIFNPTIASVQDMITALPEAETLISKKRVAVGEAKAAYDALSDSDKASVVNAGKLNACVAKVKIWDELASKVVLDASYQVLGYANDSDNGKEAVLLTNVDDNTFEKVYSIKDATYVAVTKDLKTAKASFRESENIVLYIYNPTDSVVDGNYTMNWGYYGYFQLKANSWNRIEIADFASDDVNKQMINSDATLYFYANMAGEGWKISSFYDLSDDAANVTGETVVVDAAYQTLGVGNESGNGKTATFTPGVDDTDFGKIMSVKDATYIAVTNSVKTEQAAFKESDAIAFYIYNPTDSAVNGHFTMDWTSKGYFQLKPNSWNRIFFADFAGNDVNKQMIRSDATLYFYANMAGEGWKISSFYDLSLPGENLGAEVVDPEAEAIAAVIAQITALPEPNTLQLSDKEAVITAESAYNTLSEAGKAKVENAAKLSECLAKIAELESAMSQVVVPVEALINALPDPSTIVMPDNLKDLVAIDEAKKAYDALTSEQQGYVSVSAVSKLNGCLTATQGYAIVFNAKTETALMYPHTGDQDCTGTVSAGNDVDAGPIFKLDITAKAASGGYGGGFYVYKEGSLTGVKNIVFMIYNPTGGNVNVEFYGDNWAKGFGTITLTSGWNRIDLLANAEINNGLYARIPMDQNAVGEWLISSIYSVTDEALVAEKITYVTKLLQNMPSAAGIISLDDTASIEKVNSAREAYDALGADKFKVDATLVEKLVAAEAKIYELSHPQLTLEEKLAQQLVVDAAVTHMTVYTVANADITSEATVDTDALFANVMQMPVQGRTLILEPDRQTTLFTAAEKIFFWIYNPTVDAVSGYYANDTWATSVPFTLAPQAWTRVDVDDTDASKFISAKKTIYFYIGSGAVGEGWLVSGMYADLTADELAEVEAALAPDEEKTLAEILAEKTVIDAGEKNMTMLGSGDVNISDTLNVATNNVFAQVLQLPSAGTVIAIEPNKQTNGFNTAEKISFWVYNPTESAVNGNYANDTWATTIPYTLAPQSWTRIDVTDADASTFLSGKKTIYFYLNANNPLGSEGWLISSMYADLTEAEIEEVETSLTAEPSIQEKLAEKVVIDAGEKNMTMLGSGDVNISDTLNVTENDLFTQVLQLPSAGTVLVIEPNRQTTAFNTAEKISFWVYNPTERAVNGNYANDTWATTIPYTLAPQSWTRIDVTDTDASTFLSGKKTIYFYLKGNQPLGSDGWLVTSMYADLTDAEIEDVDATLMVGPTIQERLAEKVVIDAGEKNMTMLGSGDVNICDTLNVTTNDLFTQVLQLPSAGTVLVIEPNRQTTTFNEAEKISFWVYNPTERAVNGNYANDTWATTIPYTLAPQSWTRIDVTDADASKFISNKKTIYFYLNANNPLGSDGWLVSSMYADLTTDEIAEIEEAFVK